MPFKGKARKTKTGRGKEGIIIEKQTGEADAT